MIEVRNLTKRFGARLALDDVSFTVEPGRVTAFLGPNGSGKTTTMRILLGLETATAGLALFNGLAYTDLRDPMRRVGALLDARNAHPGRTAFDHLRALALTHGIPSSRVEDVLADVGLVEVADARVGGFSLGMRQRLGIAGAMLGDPPVYVFDEPVNGLDPDGVRWFRDLVRTFAGEGRAVFLSSHLISEVALTADHVIVLGRGRVRADGSLSDLARLAGPAQVTVRSPRLGDLAGALARSGLNATVVGDALLTEADAGTVGNLAADHGIPIHQLTTLVSSLEDAYRALTDDSVEFRPSVS